MLLLAPTLLSIWRSQLVNAFCALPTLMRMYPTRGILSAQVPGLLGKDCRPCLISDIAGHMNGILERIQRLQFSPFFKPDTRVGVVCGRTRPEGRRARVRGRHVGTVT
jgi:hypothetical protein